METFPTFDEVITSAQTHLDNLITLRRAVEHTPEPDFHCRLDLGDPLRLVINSIDDLTPARQYLRKLFGTWHDTFVHVFAISTNHVIATWTNPDNHTLELWLETSPNNISPVLLTGNSSCRWEYTETTRREPTLVCPIPEAAE